MRLCACLGIRTTVINHIFQKYEIFQGGRRGVSLLAGADKGWKIVDFGAAKGVSLYVQEAGSDCASRRDKWEPFDICQ